jgi:DnaJ-class molecular chaperone
MARRCFQMPMIVLCDSAPILSIISWCKLVSGLFSVFKEVRVRTVIDIKLEQRVAPHKRTVAVDHERPKLSRRPRRFGYCRANQAYEILGIPPGRISMKNVKKAYRDLMTQYHPDRVAHLGKELQELAAKKALAFNLAIEFIEKNCKN